MSDGKYTFVVPKELKSNDQITVSGMLMTNPNRLNISLIAGSSFPDYQNIICDVEANFMSNTFTLRTVANGYAEEINGIHETFAVSDLYPGSDFQFGFTIFGSDYDGGYFMIIYVGESALSQIQLKHDIADIRFIQLNGDIEKVDKLIFQYA